MLYLVSSAFFVSAAALVIFVFVELNMLDQGIRELSESLAKHFDTDLSDLLR
jgi:hypothetical protein